MYLFLLTCWLSAEGRWLLPWYSNLRNYLCVSQRRSQCIKSAANCLASQLIFELICRQWPGDWAKGRCPWDGDLMQYAYKISHVSHSLKLQVAVACPIRSSVCKCTTDGIAVNKCDPGTSYNIYIFSEEKVICYAICGCWTFIAFNFECLTLDVFMQCKNEFIWLVYDLVLAVGTCKFLLEEHRGMLLYANR